MSDFFDRFSDAVFTMSREVSEAAKEMGGNAKLSYEIRTRKSYLDELYKELGKKYYVEHKDDEGADFKEINTLIEELHDLEDQLAERKGTKKCPVCGKRVSRDAAFCPHCGAKTDIGSEDARADGEESTDADASDE